jgi:hypothetical protein
VSKDYGFAELNVIGYADRLPKAMTPMVVPPVFGLRGEPGNALVPPFRYQDGRVINGTVICEAELRSLEAAGKITLFAQSIPAQDRHELWLDQDLNPHYEPAWAAIDRLKKIAAEAHRRAEDALLRGEFDVAAKYCRTALCANDRSLSHIVLAAAIADARGDEMKVARMRDIARQRDEEEIFELGLKDLRCRRQAAGTASASTAASAACNPKSQQASKYDGLAKHRRAAA